MDFDDVFGGGDAETGGPGADPSDDLFMFTGMD